MHAQHECFLAAIAQRRQLTFAYLDAKTQRERIIVGAPLDFGPLRGAHDITARYQLWDLGAKRPPFNVTARAIEVRQIELLDATFDPAAIIKWTFKPNAWTVVRDWGDFS
jgi:hypothetical protein